MVIRFSRALYSSFLILLLFSSCEGKIEEVDTSSCELLSFSLLCADNSVLKSDVIFRKDSINNTYNAYYLKWIDRPISEIKFVPTFTIDGESLFINGVKAISGQSMIDMSSVLSVVVKSKTQCKEYSVNLICPQINKELPVVRLLTDQDSISRDEYKSIKAILYNPKTDSYEWKEDSPDIRIKGRGNSTWLLPKKPFRIKIPEKLSPFGLEHAKAKDWVLLAHDMDKSLLRNHLAFSVARTLFNDNDYQGMPYKVFTPASEFVNVYFNDDYYGVYQLTDQIEKGDGRVDVESLGTKQGDDPSIIKGGHLLEMVYKVDDYSINFTTNRGIRIDHKYPKNDDHTVAQYQYIEQFVNEAESVLYSDTFTNKNEGWRKYFDEQSLVDFIIAKEFVGDMDGYIGTRLFKKRNYDKLCFGPVWDMDKAWGNDIRVPFPDYPPTSSLMIFGGFRTPGNSTYDWFMRFWDDKELRKSVNERWKAKRDELVDLIMNEIDTRKVAMSKSILANYKIWPYNEQLCLDASIPQIDYDAELEHIKQLTYKRVKVLDELFAEEI